MAAFLEDPPFPECISYGSVSTPKYSVAKTATRGGQESRVALWAYPLYVYQIIFGPRSEEAIQEILEFFHAVGGEYVGFRFKDWADYLSCWVGQTPTALDQPLVVSGSSPGGYQITKRYTKGARTQDRLIVKPIASTIKVANQLGVEQAPGTWSLDSTTGLLLPLGGFSGTPTTWGGEFHVPVRFEGDFPVELTNRRIESVSFTLQELRPDE